MERKSPAKILIQEIKNRILTRVKGTEKLQMDFSKTGKIQAVMMRKKDRGLIPTEDPKEIPQDSSKAGMNKARVIQVSITSIVMEKEEAQTEVTRLGTMAIRLMRLVMRTGAMEPKVRKVNTMRHGAIEAVTETEQANT